MNTPARVDLLLRGGDVIDGSGAPAVRADVAVNGDRIVAVGSLDGVAAARELDVSGRVVCPGFVDAHTHDDRALLQPLLQHPKLSQGVTTVVTGNCGISLAPLRLSSAPGGHRHPPPPFDLLGAAEDFRYDDYAAWRTAVDAARPSINAAPLIGHATLRVAVMRDIGRAADDHEIETMGALLDDAVEHGCFGLSSGLYYPPASAAPASEVRALVQRLARGAGVYTAHIRDEGDDVLGSMQEAFDIAGDVPLVLSHHKVAGRENFGRSCETLALIDTQRLSRPSLGVDVYPYAASSTSLMPAHVREDSRVLVTWSQTMPEAGGRDLGEIAAELGVTRREAAERLLPAGAVYFEMDEADVQRILAHPGVMIGSDGLPHDRHPHPRLWGTFPRVLGHYSRDLGVLPLEQAVHRMTGLPAARFGLTGRGLVATGAHADLVVFDPQHVADRATFAEPTLPAAGIDWVLVNGVPAWHAGAATGERAGRVLRRASPDTAAG